MNLAERIIQWLKKEGEKARAKGIVVGLSGGIDSAVVATLAKQAYPEHTLGIIMPCKSESKDIEDAKFMADKLKLKVEMIDLSFIWDNFLKILPAGNRISQANLKPRLRMITVYYFANKYNYLVAGTGNKSEIMLGYFTKYGDGGVDLLPLGNLLKREVYTLAEELGLPQRILRKTPSAGLWKGQTDEEEMGITYQELDIILSSLEEGGEKYQGNQETWQKVKETIKRSKHKRVAIPIFIKKVESRE